MNHTKVLMRETDDFNIVGFRSRNEDNFHDELIQKWQSIIDIGAKVMNVDAGLIMKLTNDNMEVFLKSNTPNNPYPVDGKDSLGHGLYCETVIGSNDKLYIKDALSKDKWKNNPDVKIGMISYLGYPIRYPNGDFFGTICTLDSKEMNVSDDQFVFLEILRDSIEKDLILIEKMNLIEELSFIDHLTGIYNRRFMKDKLNECGELISRSDSRFLITVLDLNNFKQVNDTFGHMSGDEVLKIFAETVQQRIRKVDYFGRIGGDEFLIVSVDTPIESFTKVIESIHLSFINHKKIKKYGVSFAYGSCQADRKTSIKFAYNKADMLMYKNKK